MIDIKADTEDQAWYIFEKKYPLYYVDQLLEYPHTDSIEE